MKKLSYALILTVLAFICWLAWSLVTLTLDARNAGRVLPYFANLCISLRPLLIILPVLAAGYCLRGCLLKTEKAPSWAGFSAAVMGVLICVVFPALVSSYWLLVDPVRWAFR